MATVDIAIGLPSMIAGVTRRPLLDHGYGAAGVAINSAPTEGVKRVPLSQIRASFPVLKNPANRHRAVGLTFEQWNYRIAGINRRGERNERVRH